MTLCDREFLIICKHIDEPLLIALKTKVIMGMILKLRTLIYLLKVGLKIGFKLLGIFLARLWHTKHSRIRNAWPWKYDAIVGVMKTSISNAPPGG